MQRKTFVVALLVVLFALPCFTSVTDAAYSDWTGIYARVDKVVLEPNATAPERIQLWGAFAMANKEDRNTYYPAKGGYLYFSCKPGKEEICRKEWADFKANAGTGQVIGFGGRSMPFPRLRNAKDKPAEPDEYPVNIGLFKPSATRSAYPPIPEVKAVPKEQQ